MQEPQLASREVTRVLGALSDENRFRIVALLAAQGDELTCGTISKALSLSPSLLSHHLAILSEAGIVGRRKNGLWTMNALQRPVLAEHIRMLESLLHGNGSASNGAVAATPHNGNAES